MSRVMLVLVGGPTMNQIQISDLKPGTVLKVRSVRFPAVMHWGVVGYGWDFNGQPIIWHSQKSDTLRRTDFQTFSSGQHCQIVRVADSPDHARRIIQRLKSKEGLPWHLTQANCEMVVRWAVEDRAVSEQLA